MVCGPCAVGRGPWARGACLEGAALGARGGGVVAGWRRGVEGAAARGLLTSMEPRQKPCWSGKAAMQRLWYLSGEAI